MSWCVEVGASYGGECNPTDSLVRDGWNALLIEADRGKYDELSGRYAAFPNTKCHHGKITPYNAVGLLREHRVPTDFELLVLDIDCYDYEVLDALLTLGYRPKKICAEINEKIPLPIQFKVLYGPGVAWDVGHFYGMSPASFNELCKRHGYGIVSADANNMLAEDGGSDAFDDAYHAWVLPYAKAANFNQDVVHWHDLPTADAIEAIKKFYAEKGKGEELYTLCA